MSSERDHGDDEPTLRQRFIDLRTMDIKLRVLTAIVFAQVVTAAILVLISDYPLGEITINIPNLGNVRYGTTIYCFSILFFLSSLVLTMEGLRKADLNSALLLLAVLAILYVLDVVVSEPPLNQAITILVTIIYIFGFCALVAAVSERVARLEKVPGIDKFFLLLVGLMLGYIVFLVVFNPVYFGWILSYIGLPFITLFYVAALDWAEIADAVARATRTRWGLLELDESLVIASCAIALIPISFIGYRIYSFGWPFVLQLSVVGLAGIYLLCLLGIAGFRGNWPTHLPWAGIALVVVIAVIFLSMVSLDSGFLLAMIMSALLCVCRWNSRLAIWAPSILLGVLIGISSFLLSLTIQSGDADDLLTSLFASLANDGGMIVAFYAAIATLSVVVWVAIQNKGIGAIGYPLWALSRLMSSMLIVFVLVGAYKAILNNFDQHVVKSTVIIVAIASEIMLSGQAITNVDSARFSRTSRLFLFLGFVTFTLAWTLYIDAVKGPKDSILPFVALTRIIEPEFAIYFGLLIMAPALLLTLFVLRMRRWFARESSMSLAHG